jgi:hypothetical protein
MSLSMGFPISSSIVNPKSCKANGFIDSIKPVPFTTIIPMEAWLKSALD